MTLDELRQAIRVELESMKAGGVHRRELSLHACKRLFFDLGIRPSAAAVRDLTLTGSASDIPKDIDHFWARIREASKVRIGAGAIPPALEEKAGELLGTLFEHALLEARAVLDVERSEATAEIEERERRRREAEIRHEAALETLARSEARAEAAVARARELEAKLATSAERQDANHAMLAFSATRLEAENRTFAALLESERAVNAGLRERLDGLQAEMRHSAEHYAEQIKDAVAQAERRVKPLLVELDSLRSMAATYQEGIRDANRKEFDFIQQLSVAKGRADRLEADVRSQSDELDTLTKQLDALRARNTVAPEIVEVLSRLARKGRLAEAEFAILGTLLDGEIVLPAACPKCADGEPEFAQVGGRYELQCPECEHTSGLGRSRLEAVTRFFGSEGAAPAT